MNLQGRNLLKEIDLTAAEFGYTVKAVMVATAGDLPRGSSPRSAATPCSSAASRPSRPSRRPTWSRPCRRWRRWRPITTW